MQASDTVQAEAVQTSELVTAIPRINIHIFCDSETTAQVMQLAAADRRMAKTHTNIHLGGIPAAIQAYSDAQTPDLLVVETTKSRDGMLNDLGHLAQVCDPNSRVIVVGHVNDITLYRELISQGISEYLFAPLHQLQLVQAVAKMYDDPDADPIGKVIAFAGAKGGVGSSMIAHNVAWTISEPLETDTVVVDLDLVFGTSGLNFNSNLGAGILDALASKDRIDQTLIDRLLTRCSDKLSLLAAPGLLDRDYDVESEAVELLLDVVRKGVPCVVVDVPPIWNSWTKTVLSNADEVVITATPDLASLRNAKNLLDYLKAARKNDDPPKLIMNQAGLQKRPEIPIADFAKAVEVTPIITIPFDAKVFGTASSNGQMIAEVDSKSKAAEAVRTLSGMLIGRGEPPKKSSGFSLPFLSRLGKRKDK